MPEKKEKNGTSAVKHKTARQLKNIMNSEHENFLDT